MFCNVVQYLINLFRVICGYKLHPGLLEVRQPLEIAAQMPAHLINSTRNALVVKRKGIMPLGKCNPLFHRQQRKLLSGAKIVLYLAENPRMPEAGPAYHNSVNSVTLKCLRSLRTVANVPVTDNGNLHPRVCLHRANQAPVRASSVHLAASPSVYGQRTDADILKPFGKLHDNLRIFVPAEPGLDRNRLADSFNHGLGDSHHLVRLTHHA